MQAYDSIMCGHFCIGFIDFILKGKSLLECTNLFSPNDYEKNDIIILRQLKRWQNYIALFVVVIENLKYLKCHSS